jgi:hypothetical protein
MLQRLQGVSKVICQASSQLTIQKENKYFIIRLASILMSV